MSSFNVLATKIYTSFGGSPKRNVRVMMFTSDGRMIDMNLPAEDGYLIDDQAERAFYLDYESLIPMKETKEYILPLYERDAVPLSFGKKNSKAREKVKENINQIAINSRKNACQNINNMIAKDKMAESIKMILLLLGCILALVIIINVLATLL